MIPATIPLIHAMVPEAIDNVRRVESFAMTQKQVDIPVTQSIHAGMYARTCHIPGGVMITGALIKIPTTLIVSGDAWIYTGERFKRLSGYNVFAAEANRKQIFVAVKDTDLTMLFPTSAKTCKEAEEQFTDEWQNLTTR